MGPCLRGEPAVHRPRRVATVSLYVAIASSADLAIGEASLRIFIDPWRLFSNTVFLGMSWGALVCGKEATFLVLEVSNQNIISAQ